MALRLTSVDQLPPSLREQARAQVGDASKPRNLPGRPFEEERRKYGNDPIVVDDVRFDSRLEWRCYEWLKARRSVGEVLWFVRQVTFELEGGVRYRADFVAVLTAGGVEVIDAKGRDTQASSNKRKQVKARYGVEVMLWPEGWKSAT